MVQFSAPDRLTPLKTIIKAEIAETGPITVARYMDLCLAHPEHGYYRSRNPLGAAGDFVTAPEVSQMFGEMVGTWVATVWHMLGRPEFKLVELGPGRGTLMADVSRVLKSAGAVPEIWMVETSGPLRTEQATRVPGARWAERLEEIPPGPAIILANEFLDALPVRQFLCSDRGWRERLVGLRDDELIWGLSQPLSLGGLWDGGQPDDSGSHDTVGGCREVSQAADRVLAWVRSRLKASAGGALFIDYGYGEHDRPNGPTLQAVREHQRADPLSEPGEADLTWLIDFRHVAASIDASVADQGAFLAAMGIGQRAEALAKSTPSRANEIADQLGRLTAPEQMGTLFKVAGAISTGQVPPGFQE